MDSAERNNLLKGKNVDFKQLVRSKIVRIFISSTFSDMAEERNMLLERAYPLLRKFCQEIGLDFQVIDMRWGIQDSASIEHSICKICTEEILTCRELSIGPYFVAFVGNRYGYRPIPSSIEKVIYKIFSQIIETHNLENGKLLTEWYKCDDNAIPACFILQPITSKYKWFNDDDPANAKKRFDDRRSWDTVSQHLSEVLRKCAELACEQEIIKEEDAMTFFKSVTELEIEEGIGKEKQPKSIYLYFREITDVEDYVKEPSANKFIDLRSNGIVDHEAKALLEKLKNKINEAEGESGNIKKYQVKWISDKGINSQSRNHVTYLEKFCNDFIDDILLSIKYSAENLLSEDISFDETTRKKEVSQEPDWVLEEIAHHARFAKEKNGSFCGRKPLVDKILLRIFMKHSTLPTIVFGESGKGKTALMAKIVSCCQNRSSCEVVVYRFLGSSPMSSNIHNVLQTVVVQIRQALELTLPGKHILQNFTNLVQVFADTLQEASILLRSNEKDLVIALDSLDQLSEMDGAWSLKWFPRNIPENVRILLSTLPEPKLAIFNKFQKLFPLECFIEVPDLDSQTGEEILQSWLTNERRRVTDEQHQIIVDAFTACPSPLFLKLAFDEAKTWHSYTAASTLRMSNSTRGAISLFFDRLEKVHGHLFVSRVIGFIVAAKNGITENELEDLLSLDDEILDDSYRYWSPPSKKVVRIPSLLWSRLRHDLGSDLVERQADGYRVLSLYHRQFIEAARERYLGEQIRNFMHMSLAHYFLGTWSNGRRKNLNLKIWNNRTIKADRQVPSQPNRFSDHVFNFRKLSELPFHLTKAEMWTDLKESVLCDAKWILDKIEAFSIKSLLEDFDFALQKKHDDGILLIRDAIKLAKPTLEFSGGIRNHVCSELFGRLEFFTKNFPQTIGKLVKESQIILREDIDTNLVPLKGCFQPPGGPLRTTLTGFKTAITCMIKSVEQPILIAGSRDGLIIVWMIGDDDVMYTVKAHESEIKCLAVSGTRVASGSSDNTLKIHNIETESLVSKIDEDHAGYQRHRSLLFNKEGSLLISATGEKINIWRLSDHQCQFTLQNRFKATISCKILLADNFLLSSFVDGSSYIWSILSGEKHYEICDPQQESLRSDDKSSSLRVMFQFHKNSIHFACLENGYIRVSDLKNERDNFFELGEIGDVFALSRDKDILAIGVKNTVKIFLVSDMQIQKHEILRYHRKPVSALTFRDDDNHLLVGSKDQAITAWNIEKAKFEKNRKPRSVIIGMGSSIEFLISYSRIIASGSSKVFYVKLWNWNRKKIVEDPETLLFSFKNNTISPCGNYLAFFDNSEYILKFLDLSIESSQKQLSLLEHFNNDEFFVTCMCFSPDQSNHLLIGTNTDIICKVPNLYKCRNPSKLLKFCHLTQQNVKFLFSAPQNNGDDHSYALAVTCGHEETTEFTFHIVNLCSMIRVSSFVWNKLARDQKISAVCFGVTTEGNFRILVGTKESKIHHVVAVKETGEATLQQTIDNHKNPITTLTFSHDQTLFFSGSLGLTRRVWRLQEERWHLQKEFFFKSLLKAGCTAAVLTRDNKYIVTGSQERSIKVWKVSSGNMLAAQYVYATVTGLGVAVDGKILATTKLGYVIMNACKLLQKAKRDHAIKNEPSVAKSTEIRRKKSHEKNSVLCCLI